MTGQEGLMSLEGHHRQLRRGGDERPVNILLLTPEDHKWAQEHPRKARELGWIVKQNEDPAEVSIVIPKTIMGKAEPEPEKAPRPKLPPRQRATIQVRVPQDERENGAELFEEYIQIGRELLCEPMGWQPNVPAYNVALTLMAKGIETVRMEITQEEMLDDA